MTPRLSSLHVGAGLYLCTQHWGQGSSPELLVVLGSSTECLPLHPSCDLRSSGHPLGPDLQ